MVGLHKYHCLERAPVNGTCQKLESSRTCPADTSYNISNIRKRYAIFVLLSCKEYSETLNQKPKIYIEVVLSSANTCKKLTFHDSKWPLLFKVSTIKTSILFF